MKWRKAPLPLWTDIIPCPQQNTSVQCTNWATIHGSPVARECPSMVNRSSKTMLRDPPNQNLENGLLKRHEEKQSPMSILEIKRGQWAREIFEESTNGCSQNGWMK